MIDQAALLLIEPPSVPVCHSHGLVSEAISTGNEFLRTLKASPRLPESWNRPNASPTPKRITNQQILPIDQSGIAVIKPQRASVLY